MCESCPTAVIDLARRLSDYAEAHKWMIHGSLHHVLEDENVSDEHIQSGLDGREEHDWNWPSIATDDETVEISLELLKLSVPERHQVIRMAWDQPNMQPWRPDY